MSDLFYGDVLSALSRAGVRHVIVGGLAVNLQGVPRFTSDLDVAIAVRGTSVADAAGVLEALGLRCRLPVSTADLGRPEVIRAWIEERNLMAISFVDPSNPLREVDLVVSSPVPFEEIERTAETLRAAGQEVSVASIDTLVRMKSGTGRAQDASDVEALLRVKEALRGR